MGAFNINITGVGGHGCDRKAKPGDKLYQRCGRFGCPDCMAHDFVQQLRQRGMLSDVGVTHSVELADDEPVPEGATEYIALEQTDSVGNVSPRRRYANFLHHATFTHWPGSPTQVVDDMLKNERKSGSF